MKKPSQNSPTHSDGELTRREALVQIGGGLAAAALVVPQRLDPLTHLRAVAPPETTGDRLALGPLRATGFPRSGHTATALPDGRILIAGGENDMALSSVELFDPLSNQYWDASPLAMPRYHHAAAPLADGRVLVVGGFHQFPLAAAEIFNPATNSWSLAAPLRLPRYLHAAVALPGGQVVVTGGLLDHPLVGAEIYDPVSDGWSPI